MSNRKSVLLIFLMFLLVLSILPFQINEVHANPTYEDFLNNYTLVGSHITRTTTNATYTQLTRDEDSYLYKDFGLEHFGNFTHDLDFQINGESNIASGWQGITGGWVLSNDLDDLNGLKTGGKHFIWLWFITVNTKDKHEVSLWECDGGTLYNSGSGAYLFTNAVTYYTKIIKDGTSLKCGIYSTAELRNVGDATDGDMANFSLVLHHDYTFQYIGTCWSWDDNFAQWSSGFVENLDLQEVAGEEYFETITETLTVTDAPTHYTSYTRLLTETTTILDSLLHIGTFTRIITDPIKIFETPQPQATFQRLITETINILEQISLHIGIFLQEAIVETIHITDSITLIKEAVPFTIGLPLAMALITIACIVTYVIATNMRKEEEHPS